MESARFEQAIAAIDTANAADPNKAAIDGHTGPKEVVHAELLTGWMHRLVSEPSEALLLAARAHHIRRWEHPRSSQPDGRSGYLRWRTGLYRFHGETAAAILREAGYDEATIGRVELLVSKRAPAADPEAQALEDGLCLVFLQTQLSELAGRIDRDKMVNILRRTWKKMSPAGRAAALELTLAPEDRELVAAALG